MPYRGDRCLNGGLSLQRMALEVSAYRKQTWEHSLIYEHQSPPRTRLYIENVLLPAPVFCSWTGVSKRMPLRAFSTNSCSLDCFSVAPPKFSELSWLFPFWLSLRNCSGEFILYCLVREQNSAGYVAYDRFQEWEWRAQVRSESLWELEVGKLVRGKG